MLKMKALLPSPINKLNGTLLKKLELENGAESMTIVAAIYSQKRKLYNQSVANNAFFFLIN